MTRRVAWVNKERGIWVGVDDVTKNLRFYNICMNEVTLLKINEDELYALKSALNEAIEESFKETTEETLVRLFKEWKQEKK